MPIILAGGSGGQGHLWLYSEFKAILCHKGPCLRITIVVEVKPTLLNHPFLLFSSSFSLSALGSQGGQSAWDLSFKEIPLSHQPAPHRPERKVTDWVMALYLNPILHRSLLETLLFIFSPSLHLSYQIDLMLYKASYENCTESLGERCPEHLYL